MAVRGLIFSRVQRYDDLSMGVLQVKDIYGIRERRLIRQLTVPRAPKHKFLRLHPHKALFCHIRHRSLNDPSQAQIP